MKLLITYFEKYEGHWNEKYSENSYTDLASTRDNSTSGSGTAKRKLETPRRSKARFIQECYSRSSIPELEKTVLQPRKKLLPTP